MKDWEMRQARVLEIDPPPIIYIDGVLHANVRGPITHVTSFAYRRWVGEWVKVPVVEIIRPTAATIDADIKAIIAQNADVAVAH